MRLQLAIFVVISVFLSMLTMADRVYAQQPAGAHQHGQQSPAAGAQDHAAHMAAMKAFDAKLADLVKLMNNSTGQAKTDAIAELLTAIVEHHQTMCAPMMAEMMSKMGTGGPAAPESKAPVK